MKKVLTMILAGGQGKRMGVLCHVRPKPLLPFGSRFRVIDFTLSNCVNSGLNDIAILSSYRYSQITDYMQVWESVNPGRINLTLLHPANTPYQGTADALIQNIQYLKKHQADIVLILSADHVYNMDYRKMIEFHHTSAADVTIGITPVPLTRATLFGIVEIDPQSRITDFTEKPSQPRSNLASMGIYIFKKNVLLTCLERDAADSRSIHDLGYSILPNLIRGYTVSTYKYVDYWQDIGTSQTYFDVNLAYINGSPLKQTHGNWPIFTAQSEIQTVTGYGYENVSDSIISPGCVIKGKVQNSILSPGVWVEEKAIVRDSIVLPNVFIDYHSVVDHCIIDEGAHISKYSFIGFKGSRIDSSDDITIIGKDAIIPPFTAVMRSSKTPPYSSMGEYKGQALSFNSQLVPSRSGSQSDLLSSVVSG